MTEKATAPWDPPAGQVQPIDAEAVKIARLDKLRAPFDARAIGKLPRVTCGACRDTIKGKQGKSCGRHGVEECRVCGAYMTVAHMHLDYVGHAEVTDRLLSVDPFWDWSPLATEADGLPKFIRSSGGNPLGLWIKLTVLGTTRLGYGSVEPGAFDAEKQLIGDALRNAAMRFGVALDLWSKAELESSLEPVDVATGEVVETRDRPSSIPAREQAEIDAFATGSAPAPQANRVILGIPILTTKTWEMVKTLPIGGKSKYAALTLDKMIDENADDGRVEFLESEVIRAIQDKWNRTVPAKKNLGVGLTSECALIAYNELMERRSPSPLMDTEEVK